jgi:FAD/FMN-containing dehydrogenase
VLGGRLEPLALSLEAILPDGIPFVSKASPRSAAGPDLDALILGGEGRFGWVSRATLRLLPRPVSLRRVVHSYPDAATLTRAARRLLAAGCNVQCAWAQRRGGRVLLEVELGGTDESVPRDLSTCAHEAAEAGGRASEQVLDDAPAGEERELSWDDVAQELARGGRLALFRLSNETVVATGASRGRSLTAGQGWAQPRVWDDFAAALAPPRGDAE